MEFKPRYSQPFTLVEATAMDVSIITEEITRLQNSLHHLKQTQDTLREYLADSPADPDPEFVKALQENEVVIGSQEERILLLKLALSEKGIHAGTHYDLDPGTTANTTSIESTTTTEVAQEHSDNVNNGIHL